MVVESRTQAESSPVRVNKMAASVAKSAPADVPSKEVPVVAEQKSDAAVADVSKEMSALAVTHPLENEWTWWYDRHDKKQASQNYASHIQKIKDFNTVEDFWRVFNNVVAPSKLSQGADLAVFKGGVKPMWEDPANAKGGKWVLQIPRANRNLLDQYWMHLLLCLIGENFEWGEDICGIVVSMRRSADKLAVWTRSALNEQIQRSVGTQIKEFLQLPERTKLQYSFHNDSLKRNSSFNVKNVYEL